MGLTGAENFHKLVGFYMASQGLISMARGDGFVQGAVSGFIGKISGSILQGIESDVTSSVIAGVFGGVASKATGGNFLQGALQAATVHLYNQRGGKAAEKESFASYFGGRVMSGQVRDDIFTFGGSLVSSFTFGFVEPGFVDRNSSAFEVGQVTSLGLGGAGLIRSIYFGGTKGLSALASASGSESIVLGLSGFRNFTKLATNPALWFNSSLRSAHVVPASARFQNAGSVQALASKIGSTNAVVDATLIPLTPFTGAAFND